jgi:heme/copper-type cytochrome/quinol oxidase subunit 3
MNLNPQLTLNSKNRQAEQHPFHLVNPSPWPIFISLFLLLTVFLIVLFLHYEVHTYPCSYNKYTYIFSTLCFFVTIYAWFNDIVIEGTFEGHHTKVVQKGLKFGMLIFIVSEILFFFAFFWAFFHSSIAPSIWVGNVWPPHGINVLSAFNLPILNTLIILSSGISVTWAHRAIVSQSFFTSRRDVIIGLLVTIGYGFVFTIIQRFEYIHADFCFNDSIYASTFYALTGLHGLHVLIGTIFLLICLLRQLNYHFTVDHHFGLEAAIWYWHFVDVVWLFLFVSIYWWGAL